MKLGNCRVTVGGVTTAWGFGVIGGDVSTVTFFGGNAPGGKTIAIRRQSEIDAELRELYELRICAPPRSNSDAATSPLARVKALKRANRESLDAKTGRKPYD